MVRQEAAGKRRVLSLLHLNSQRQLNKIDASLMCIKHKQNAALDSACHLICRKISGKERRALRNGQWKTTTLGPNCRKPLRRRRKPIRKNSRVRPKTMHLSFNREMHLTSGCRIERQKRRTNKQSRPLTVTLTNGWQMCCTVLYIPSSQR